MFCLVWFWKPICSLIIILKILIIENTRFFFYFYQFSSGMKYENQDFCPRHINVKVLDDRIWDDYFGWWVPFPPSDYLIHHFNHISPLPTMMTKPIIVTSENFHKLALAYLILSDFCFFPPKMHFVFQSIELQSCHLILPLVCLCLLHSPGNSLNWACPVVYWKKFRTKSQANKCARRPALLLELCDLKHFIWSFWTCSLCCKMRALSWMVPSQWSLPNVPS